MTIDRLDAMRTFVAIVDAGSFSAAAKRLGVSVPAISRRLSGFEERLGTPLLHRTTRSVEPTEYGHVYYERATRILSEIEQVELELAGMRQAPSGLLRVAAPRVFGRTFVAPVIPAFLNRYPHVRVDLALVRPWETPDAGTVDASIQLGEQRSSTRGLGTRALGAYRHVLCAAPNYLKRSGTPRRPEELSHHDCIVETSRDGARWHFQDDGRDVDQPVQARLVCDDSDAVLSAALAGSGVARIPSFQLRDHVRARRLEVLLEAFEPPPTPTQISYSKDGPALPKVSAFVQFLASNISQDQFEL
jgi:DNA-binding transcriptional LysR family regulator